MKYVPQYLIAGLLVILGGCQKSNDPIPTECRVASITSAITGSNALVTFIYDSNGRIAQEATSEDSAGVKRTQYLFTFNYDARALTQTSWTRNGQQNGSETYSYASANGYINKVTFTYTNGFKGVNNITRNNAGLITTFTTESGLPESDQKQYFEYNATNQLTKYTITDGKGNGIYEIRYTLVGKVPTPESQLLKAGLQYDIARNSPWILFSGGEGSTRQIYTADKTGQLVLSRTDKLTVSQSNGYGISRIWTDAANPNAASTMTYSLTGCN